MRTVSFAIVAAAASSLVSCGEPELPAGAYGRAPNYEWACQRFEGLQRINELYAVGDTKSAELVSKTLWGSGSCISFSTGDPFYFSGESKDGFVKIGREQSNIIYYADRKILNGRQS